MILKIVSFHSRLCITLTQIVSQPLALQTTTISLSSWFSTTCLQKHSKICSTSFAFCFHIVWVFTEGMTMGSWVPDTADSLLETSHAQVTHAGTTLQMWSLALYGF